MTSFKRFWLFGLIALALVVVAVACGEDATPTPTATTAPPTATPTTAPGVPTPTPTRPAPTASPTPTVDILDVQPAGTAVAAFIGIAGSSGEKIEPGSQLGNSLSLYAGEMYDWFVYTGNDGSPSKELGALSDWVMSPDGKKWTFTMRKGMRWHDGEPVTSADAVFSIERYGQEDAICFSCGFVRANVTSAVALGDLALEVNFKTPDIFFPEVVLIPIQGDAPILPKHHWEAVGGAAGFTDNPMGSGPMKFVDRKIGQFIEFEANEGYWNKWRIPGFKVIRKIVVPESTTRLALVERGDADMALMSPQDIQSIKNAGLRIMGPQDQWFTVLFFCQSWDPAFATNRLEVRKAITLAMDRKALSDIAYPGEAGSSIDLPFSPSQEGYRTDLEPYPFDPVEARRIVQAEGLEGLEIIMPQYDFGVEPALPVLQEAAAAMLEEVGFSPRLIPLDFGSIFGDLFDGTLEGPVQIHPYLWSTTAKFDSSLKLTFASHEAGGSVSCFPDLVELDRRYNELIGELDQAKRIGLAQDITAWLGDQYPYIPISIKNEIWATGPRIGEWLPSNGVPINKMLETLKPVGDPRIGLDPFK